MEVQILPGALFVSLLSAALLRRITFALADPARAAQAAHALTGCDALAALEGLHDLLEAPSADEAALAGIRALSGSRQPLARLALRHAAQQDTSAVRCAALHTLRLQQDPADAEVFAEILAHDPSVRVRREALRALARLDPAQRWPLLAALSDPVWRIRDGAVRHLLEWERQAPGIIAEARRRNGDGGPLAEGALRYLEFLATPNQEPPPRTVPVVPPWQQAAWWDDDPPVLLRNLRHLTARERKVALPLLPGLLTLQDGRPVASAIQGIHRFVADTLVQIGQPEHIAAARALLAEPRRPRMEEWAVRLGGMPSRTSERQPDDVPDHVRRARELTKEQAEALWQQPEYESSWRVLRRAAELLDRPLDEIAPTPSWGRQAIRASDIREDTPSPLLHWHLPPVPASVRLLGRTGLAVSPLGLSGRYSLPERGFREAMDAGVNLFFWEPGYHTQTRVWQRLPSAMKERLVVVAGSFQADARLIRRDLESALRTLRIERLAVFLLFWVRSPGRLDEETLEELERMRQKGLVQAVGLSTHLRPLAVQALRDGYPVLMVRHSLAHPGAEEELLPLAHELDAGVLTFSALCYGRLLGLVGAADCYRYALCQPGVSACWMAPRTLAQLRANLEVLRQPALEPEELARLRLHGNARYREHRAFVEWIRSR